MAERKPQRGSWKIIERRLAALKRLERAASYLKGRVLREAEEQRETLAKLEKEEEDIAREKAMNDEEMEEIRFLDDRFIPSLATAILGQQIEDQSETPVSSEPQMKA